MGQNPAWNVPYAPAYGGPYPADASQEMSMLRNEAESLKRGLDEINRRIAELEKASSE
jgi:prefoldin subunit 5